MKTQRKAVEDWTDRDYWQFAWRQARDLAFTLNVNSEIGRLYAVGRIVAKFAERTSADYEHLMFAVLCAGRAVQALHQRRAFR